MQHLDDELFDSDLEDFLNSKLTIEKKSFSYYEYFVLSKSLINHTVFYIQECVSILYSYIFA